LFPPFAESGLAGETMALLYNCAAVWRRMLLPDSVKDGQVCDPWPPWVLPLAIPSWRFPPFSAQGTLLLCRQEINFEPRWPNSLKETVCNLWHNRNGQDTDRDRRKEI
jgi:hypothetical protein